MTMISDESNAAVPGYITLTKYIELVKGILKHHSRRKKGVQSSF